VHIGDALRARRDAAGLTQEGAAARAGITRNALAALEKQQFPNPALRTVLALMQAYELDTVEALFGTTPSALAAATLAARGQSDATQAGT
jgi:transcriptional regulator with XRE-family HTH domain